MFRNHPRQFFVTLTAFTFLLSSSATLAESPKAGASAWEAAPAPEKKTEAKVEHPKPAPKPEHKVEHKTEAKREIAAETKAEAPQTPTASGKPGKAELLMRIEAHCYNIEFDQVPGELVSCTEPLPLTYTKRECATQKLMEIAEAEAMVSCEDKKRITLRFKTSDGMVASNVRVQRIAEGRAGISTTYKVESSREEESSLSKLLAEPKIKPLDGEKPEEAGVAFKFSGFAAVEYDRTKRFGYDGTGAQTNFTDGSQPDQGNLNFFSNLNFEVSKDRTSLVSILEVGEMFFGDTNSGGGLSAGAGSSSSNARILEVRNMYLNHSFNDFFGAKAGLITSFSDPRSFIFNNHVASVHGTYKTDLSEGYVWFANANQNRPGRTKAHDHYVGLSGTLGFLTGIKGTVYYLYRGQGEQTFQNSTGSNVIGDVVTQWGGTTLEWSGSSPVSAQLTGIYNWSNFKAGTEEDNLKAYLLDGKVSYNWEAPQLTFSLEGLMTSGSKDGYSGTTPIIGKRKNFQSPVNTSYLLSIATSDGLDDAPGSYRESVIGGMGNNEGLQLGVFTTTANLNKRTTVFGRYGMVNSVAENATTNSKKIGQEFDLGGVYQLSPSTTLQLDYGYFKPGAYYTANKAATLMAARMKFTF